MDERFRQEFELFANMQAAELEATRAILEGLVVLIFGTFPRGEEMMARLREIALQPLIDAEKMAKTPDETRKSKLVLEQASSILAYLTARIAEAHGPTTRGN